MTGDVLKGRTFAAVLFDLDGTLVDSTAAVQRSWQTWVSERGRTMADLGEMHGVPARDLVRRIVPQEQAKDGLRRIDELELADLDGITALPGAEYALNNLPRDHVAIVTSGRKSLAEARLAAARLAQPTVLVCADDIVFGKPAPDAFLTAARRLGVAPEDCLVVEDAVSGLAAGRAAGCATIALTTTTDRALLAADIVTTDLSAVHWNVTDEGIQVAVPTPLV